ncbi:MAG TPA: hypothetical protein VGL71_05595, partial [Urbifossiella sp.]
MPIKIAGYSVGIAGINEAAVAHSSESSIVDADIPIEAAQIAEHFHAREEQLAEHERQLIAARAEFRKERDAEREKLAAERTEIDRLQREAQTLHREAGRERDRTRRLAVRYARRVRHKWADVRVELETQQKAIDEARGQFSAEIARFNHLQSEFQLAAAEEKERQREAWAELETHRKRMVAEWTETNSLFAKQETALAARSAEVAQREQVVAGTKARLDKETAGLRQEAAGLEARAAHSRGIVEELEKKRDELRSELLALVPKPAVEPPGEFSVALDRRGDRDLTQWAAELDAQDQRIVQEKANLARLKESLDRETTTLADQRKVLAEQYAMLSAARSDWQNVEARTVMEMEELARALRHKEEEVAARDERLVKADARRREEAHDLWRQRLRLEAWQSKLTMVSRVWHVERERREGELTVQAKTLSIREATLREMFERWEQAREEERERLQTELQLWADDRLRMAKAAEEFDRRGNEMLGELATHAARAMAAEDLLAETTGKGKGVTRRFQVLRKRWDRVFAKKLAEADGRRAAVAADLAQLDDRYRDV